MIALSGGNVLEEAVDLSCDRLLIKKKQKSTTNPTQISMTPAGFEPAIPAGERPHTYALDGVATGIGRIRSPDRPARS